MTMIRINLIAERKAGAPKAVKKPTGQSSELQENLILIVAVLIAIGCFAVMRHMVKAELAKKTAEVAKKAAHYKTLEDWPKKKEDYELQKELLNEKIERITELKDRRQGPVKLLEDIYNVRPDSVWLSSISQGFDKGLLAPTVAGRNKPNLGKSIGSGDIVLINGFASSHEAITQFANQIVSMDNRYKKTDLNRIERLGGADSQQYRFEIWFEIAGDPNKSEPAPEPKQKGRKKRKK